MSTFGERIKDVRKSTGKTQSQFAEYIGSTQSAIANWESGSRVPAYAVIKAIAEKCNCSELWLRTGEGKMPIDPDQATRDENARLIGKAMANADPRYRQTVVRLVQTTPTETMAACLKELLRWADAIEATRREVEGESPEAPEAPE